MLHKDINLINLDKARELLDEIYGELSLNPNIQEKENLLLADIALALHALKEKNPPSFIATGKNAHEFVTPQALR